MTEPIKLPPLDEVADLLATVLHFIPKTEPEIYRDAEKYCAAFAVASRQEANEADRLARGEPVAIVTGDEDGGMYAELVDGHDLETGQELYATPQPQQQASELTPPSSALGPIKVGNLPTVNQDDYPGLSSWWVQLRVGPDNDEVLARVYGNTPQQAYERAILLVRPQPQQVPECPFPCGWDGLHKIAVKDAAYLAKLDWPEDEEGVSVPRATVMRNIDYLIQVCRAMLNTSPESKEPT